MLTFDEKQVFENNQTVFLEKKTALFKVSDITNKQKSLHAKLKLIPDGPDKQQLATEIVDLDKQRIELFKLIDSNIRTHKTD